MRQRAKHITASGIIGGAATLLLHSLFLTAALWGGGSAHRFPDRPDAMGAGANVGKPEGDSGERRIVVQLLTEVGARPSPSTPDAYLAEQIQKALKLEITGPDALPLPPLLIDEHGVSAESTDAELIARTKLVGVYESQMRARIERAWTLPDGAVTDQAFTCRVLIRQLRDGQVKEVEVPYEHCNGTDELRQSVVRAIFTASPLPAPPHPGVFVDSFSLILRSDSIRGR